MHNITKDNEEVTAVAQSIQAKIQLLVAKWV